MEPKITLKDEFQYYLDNQADLVKSYPDKYLVIKNNEVVGVYNSQSEAYDKATEKYKLGTFLIQHCQAGSQSYTQTFHSRAIIHHSI